MGFLNFVVLVSTLMFGICNGQLPENPDLKCRLRVAHPGFKTLAQNFHIVRWLNGVIVKIRPKLLVDGGNRTVPLVMNHTDMFDPTSWVWAKDYGKYMLKFPLDYEILSLGILTLNAHKMEIVFQDDPPGCALEASSEELVESFIPIITNASLDQNVFAMTQVLSRHFFICRSAYTSTTTVGMKTPLVGAKCCYKDLVNDRIQCDREYTDNWELVWFGTAVVMVWLYLTCVIIGIRIYITTSMRYKTQSQVLMMDSMITEVKRRLVVKLARYAQVIPLAKYHTDLMSHNESITMATALGLSDYRQRCVSKVIKKVSVTLVFLLYYGYFAAMGYYYYTIKHYIRQLKDSASVYTNVFGHIGWLYSNPDFGIHKYAIAEVCLTAIIPFLLMFLYYTVKDYAKFDTETVYDDLFVKRKNLNVTPFKSRCSAFLSSGCGRFLQIISFVVVLLWVVIIGGVLFSYSCYFILFGTIVALDKLSMWILPVYVAIYYIYSIFRPLKNYYKTVKEKIFSVCNADYSDLVIKSKGHQFILEKIMTDFYYPRTRKHVFDAFIKSMVAIAVLMLLLIVVATAQNLAKFDISEVKIVGYNLIVLLPLIATFLIKADKEVELESQILEYDVQEHLKIWIKDNETVVSEHRKRAELLKLKHQKKEEEEKSEEHTGHYEREESEDPKVKTSAENSIEREASNNVSPQSKPNKNDVEELSPEYKPNKNDLEMHSLLDKSKPVNSVEV